MQICNKAVHVFTEQCLHVKIQSILGENLTCKAIFTLLTFLNIRLILLFSGLFYGTGYWAESQIRVLILFLLLTCCVIL